MDHHGNGLVGVEVGITVDARETQQGLFGVGQAAVADKPPGRLGTAVDTDEERQWPHPLQSIWNAVSPLIGAIQHGVNHTDTDNLTQAPAEVDVGGEITAEGDRADLGGVGDGDGLENTPRDSTQNFGDDESLDVLGGEEDGDEAGKEDEAGEESFTVAPAFGDVAVDEETDDFAAHGTLLRLSIMMNGGGVSMGWRCDESK